MVVVQFYRNKSENIKVDKELTHVIDENIIFKDDVEILRPYVILTTKINTNYAYIADFGRYYYVTVTNLTGGRYRYDFTVDVLKSHIDKMQNCKVIATRSSNIYNKYLSDNCFKSYAYSEEVTKVFPRGFNIQPHTYLVVNGNGGA